MNRSDRLGIRAVFVAPSRFAESENSANSSSLYCAEFCNEQAVRFFIVRISHTKFVVKVPSMTARPPKKRNTPAASNMLLSFDSKDTLAIDVLRAASGATRTGLVRAIVLRTLRATQRKGTKQ